MTSEAPAKPSVLFVCIHNAGRSQMAAAFLTRLSGGAVEVRSAGSAPADSINPAVREVMLEQGIDSISLNPDTVVETWMFLADASAGRATAPMPAPPQAPPC